MITVKKVCKHCFYLFFIVLLISCTADNDLDDASETRFSEVQDLIEQVCRETGTPGVSVHVISPRHGDRAYSAGVSDIDTAAAVSPEDLFRIGSLTKSFTGAAVVKLVEDGWIDLNKPVNKYLEVIKDYPLPDDIRVCNLLNMSSGLAEYLTPSFLMENVLTDPWQSYDPEVLLSEAFVSSPELLFTPGSRWSYSNTDYILLGLLIEAVSDMSYQDYIHQNLIDPLGLKETRVIADSTVPGGLVGGYYDYDEDGRYEDWTVVDMSYVWSAGCIVSTARDMAHWIRCVAKGDIVSEAFQPYLLQGISIADGVAYGAGILIDNGFGIGHNGTVIGFHADAWHDPATDITVAVLCNTNYPLLSDDRDPTREIAEGVLTIFN